MLYLNLLFCLLLLYAFWALILFKNLNLFYEVVVIVCLQFLGYLKAYFYYFDMCIISPSSFAKGTPKGEGEGG